MASSSRSKKPKEIPRLDVSTDFIFIQILPKLPAASLVKFMTVSRRWKAFISTVKFSKTHALYQSSISRCVLTLDKSDKWFEFLDYGDSNNLVSKKIRKNFGDPYSFVNSTCNGLVFLVSYPSDPNKATFEFSYVVHNPLLGPDNLVEVHHPPELRVFRNDYYETTFDFGFVYVSSRDDYCIVAVTLPIDFKNDVAAYVYSLRSHQWETYTDTLRVTSPLLFNKYWRGRAGTLVKEILHWPMSGDDKEDSYVFAFDLASEEHAKLMPWPPFHQGQHVEAALCCLDGCLCAWADNAADNVVEMWMMKDYGNGKSWTKLFRFQTDDHRFCDFFGRNMTGMGLVHTFENELILADFTRDSRNFSNVALKSKCSVSDYVPSLVSLLPIVSDANDKKDDNNLLD